MPRKIGSPPPSPHTSKSPSPSSSSATASSSKKRKADGDGGQPAKLAKTDEKDMSTEARMKRARDRQTGRMQSSTSVAASQGRSGFVATAKQQATIAPAKGAKQQLQTPAGPVNLSKFPTSDPGFKVTTQAKNYGKQSVKDRYPDMVNALKTNGTSDQKVANDLLRMLDGHPPQDLTSDKQKNAAAKFLAVTHVSEPQRVGGTDKQARAALRMVASGEATLDEAFTGDKPIFTMAKNPTYTRRVVNYQDQKFRTPVDKPQNFDKLSGHMSDSSDDEADPPGPGKS